MYVLTPTVLVLHISIFNCPTFLQKQIKLTSFVIFNQHLGHHIRQLLDLVVVTTRNCSWWVQLQTKGNFQNQIWASAPETVTVRAKEIFQLIQYRPND